MRAVSRGTLTFVLITIAVTFLMTRGLIAQPGYTDAFYHLNAANRLVSGQGLTDTYLWTYIALPDDLPAPSHLYWMPLTSWAAALGMWLFNAPGDYGAAQFFFTIMLIGTVCVAFWLGQKLGGTRRHAWVAGLVALCGGFFVRFWGATDTFAPYAFIGSLCLIAMGQGASSRSRRAGLLWFGAAGALAALGHLTRADGLLLLVVGWLVVLWPFQNPAPIAQRAATLIVMTLAYMVVMFPWFVRSMQQIGAPLPLGGAQSIWYTDYNDLFNYPPDVDPGAVLSSQIGPWLGARWQALVNNLGTFLAVEGLIAMAPLMLLALWKRRDVPFLRGFWLYTLGLHLAMTFVFPLPGYRGGLFHSAAAFVPWWAALGVVGLDDAVDWVARRRRHWKPDVAKTVFSAGLIALAFLLSLSVAANGAVGQGVPALYRELRAKLPDDARIMINDPAQLYYFTGLGGVVLPNEAPSVIPDIARRYGISFLLLEGVTPDGQVAEAAPASLWPILTAPPGFLEPISLDIASVRLYAIRD